ncbi:MAG: hypothetical protein L6Q98_23540 [Anaerolineae bacterium]|nr:hypothetical protein [Anaerolineae bacterium]NUQ06372.1 hypothetical protein [Anaerolineae bacterium]
MSEVPWKSCRRLTGYPTVTWRMFVVLRWFEECRVKEFPFVTVADVSIPYFGTTLKALERHGFIFSSPGRDEVCFSITGVGQRALRAYSKPPRGMGGREALCPRCKSRAKEQFPHSRGVWCTECRRESVRKYQKMKAARRAGAICPCCRERPLHRTSSGRLRGYCRECHNSKERARQQEKRQHHE